MRSSLSFLLLAQLAVSITYSRIIRKQGGRVSFLMRSPIVIKNASFAQKKTATVENIRLLWNGFKEWSKLTDPQDGDGRLGSEPEGLDLTDGRLDHTARKVVSHLAFSQL